MFLETILYQICSSIPPSNDAVGEFASKLNKLLNKEGINSLILTNKSDNGALAFFDQFKFTEIIKFVSYLISKHGKLVIIHYPGLLYKRNISINILPIILRFFRIKSIIYLHEFDTYSKLGKIRILPMLFFSNFVITTDSVNNKLLNYILPKFKFTLLPAGSNLNDDSFNHTPNHEDISSSGKKIKLLYFGLIMEGKGLEPLLNFFQKESSFFEKFELNIMGGLPDVVKDSDLKLLDKINRTKSVNYWGFIKNEDLPMKFSIVDAVILPFEKGLTERRTSFMTAAGFGKLVLTTRGQYDIEGLKDGENIIYLKDLSGRELEKVLNQLLLMSPHQIDLMGEKLKNWYFENYSDRKFISKFSSIIKNLYNQN